MYNVSGLVYGKDDTPTYNQAHALATVVSSLDLSTTFVDTSCLAVSTPVLSATFDTRTTKVNAAMYPRHTYRKAPLTVTIEGANCLKGAGGSNTNKFTFTPYEDVNTTADLTKWTVDVSAVNQATDLQIFRPGVTTVNGSETESGNVYFNRCQGISVKNCDGPIYIRNFFVDGELITKNGIDIQNSDVLLENCTSVRNKEAGFKFNNSKVVLSRSAASYRNYTLTSTTTRAPKVGYGFHTVRS